MNEIMIRQVTLDDIPGIQHLHRYSEDPWSNLEKCRSWITKRIERGFYIQVALINQTIVGHGEWIESIEEHETFFYLGLLEVDEKYRNQGIGRKMVEDGVTYAKNIGCKRIVTIPEQENNSIEFYKKCGFEVGRQINTIQLPSKDYEYSQDYIASDTIPFSFVKHCTFVFGLSQASSRHMWEVYNEKPSTDERYVKSVSSNDGDIIQLGWFDKNNAQVLYYSHFVHTDCIKDILTFAYRLGIHQVTFTYFALYETLFQEFDSISISKSVEIYRLI